MGSSLATMEPRIALGRRKGVALAILVGPVVALIGLVMNHHRAPAAPHVQVMPAPVEETLRMADTTNLGPALRPGSPNYTKTAFWDIRSAMHRAAAASRAGRNDEAAKILSDRALERTTGVIVERYLAMRVEGRPGTVSHADAARLESRLFDVTYAIGQPGHRAVRLGQIDLLVDETSETRTSIFASDEDETTFGLLRVLSLMETWTRVWQDVAGVQPIAETTRRYLATAGTPHAGWSNVDVLALYDELGMTVPASVIADARFPEWTNFRRWLDVDKAIASPAID